MYDHLVGDVVERRGSRIVLRVHDVGYELKVSLTTSAALQQGRTATLYTLLHVVDGTPSLLGFATRSERELARRLLATSGVGPAIALSVLSVFTPAETVRAIATSDVAALKRVKGVGQKTAERLCLELRDAVRMLDIAPPGEAAVAVPSQTAEDAVLALQTLGYSEKEARDKVERVRGRDRALASAPTEDLVKAVLQL
jgi:Holliday junction DNA helicase RuvA